MRKILSAFHQFSFRYLLEILLTGAFISQYFVNHGEIPHGESPEQSLTDGFLWFKEKQREEIGIFPIAAGEK